METIIKKINELDDIHQKIINTGKSNIIYSRVGIIDDIVIMETENELRKSLRIRIEKTKELDSITNIPIYTSKVGKSKERRHVGTKGILSNLDFMISVANKQLIKMKNRGV